MSSIVKRPPLREREFDNKVWQRMFDNLWRQMPESGNIVSTLGLTANRLAYSTGTRIIASVTNLASWIAGTALRITVTDDGDGTITITIPDTPTLVGLTLSGLTASRLLSTNGSKGLASVGALTNGKLLKASSNLPVDATNTDAEVAAAVTASHAAVTLSAALDSILGLSTQELGLDNQSANTFLAGPSSGSAAAPTMRAMITADLPTGVFQNAKGQLIDGVYGIVTPTNMRVFVIFDQTGAVSTITDRSTIGGITAHTTTLKDASLNAINASTCTPGVAGLSPYLTLNTTHTWDCNDAADLTFALAPFSLVALVKPTLAADGYLLAKQDFTTGSEQREIYHMIQSTGGIVARLYDNATAGMIGRTSPAGSVVADTWQTIALTYDGGTAATGIKSYVNGAQVDNTTVGTGTFNTIQDTTARLGNYNIATGGGAANFFRGLAAVQLVIAEELTAVQLKRLDAILRGYAGVVL